jgi:hypothetical protein
MVMIIAATSPSLFRYFVTVERNYGYGSGRMWLSAAALVLVVAAAAAKAHGGGRVGWRSAADCPSPRSKIQICTDRQY